MNFVSGATGILGSHVLLRLMQDEQPVIAGKQKASDILKVKQLFSYYNAAHLFDKIHWKDFDVRDVYSIEEAIDGVDTIYHCAGFVSFNGKDRKKLFDINETGTFNMVTAAHLMNVKAFCHASSIATINNSDYLNDLDENVFWKKSGKESDYALSKYNAEREVWRSAEEGLNALVVNPGVLLSPGFWNQSSSMLFTRCYEGNAFYTSGNAAYISARDAAAAMIGLTERRQFGNRYILIEGNYTFKQIFSEVALALGKRKPVIEASRWMLHLGRLADLSYAKLLGREQVLTRSIVNSAFNKQKFSNAKLLQILDFKLKPVEQEIKDICAIYLKERQKVA